LFFQKTEAEYREQLLALNDEKCQVEQRLQEANQALDLADSHLQEEIEKIKTNLEQEYNRRYERDHKQHQHDLQQLTNEFNKQRSNSPSTNLSNNSLQDIADVKKIYRTEIDRLYRKRKDFLH
jgi:vacuolar-type H+-ATPase subunit E/Vma4